MAIKNWTVKTKQIKKKDIGLINHFNYLFNEKRSSHFYSEIVDLNSSPDKLNNILTEIDERKEYRRENGLRGGGVSNLATSFVLSIPRNIQQPTTKKEWQKIAAISLMELAKDIDMPFEKIQKNSVVVLHDESNSVNKSSHIHILVGNVIDGKVIKPISQYQGTYSMKKGFNKAVKHVLKEDNNLYVPLNENVGDKPLHVSRAEEAEKRDNLLDQKQDKLNQDFKNKKSEIKIERLKLKEEHNAFKKSINYAKSILSEWIKSVRSNQKYELEKRAARSAKVIIDMSVKLPRVADRLVIIASNEEQLLQDLKDESKVTYQLEKIKEKTKKRRTRTRSKN